MITKVIDAREPHTERAARQAVTVLAAGGVVAIPTDTVYGIAVRADDDKAVRRLYDAKVRPDRKAIPILLPDTGALEKAAREVPEAARILAEAFWPGPLTIVVPKSESVSDAVTSGMDTVGVRVPDHPVALAVLSKCEFLVAVTSANVSSRAPAREPDQVRRDFSGQIEMILSVERCPGGASSTVVDVSGETMKVLRAGALPVSKIQGALKNAGM